MNIKKCHVIRSFILAKMDNTLQTLRVFLYLRGYDLLITMVILG